MELAPRLLSATVMALVGSSMAYTLVTSARTKYLREIYIRVVRGIRWWMPFTGLVNIAAVTAAIIAMWTLPFMRFSWWKLISGSSSNAALGQTGFDGTTWKVAGFLILMAVTAAIPMLALAEERKFRAELNHETTPRRAWEHLKFGLMHSLLMGVPLAAGVALTISGLYFYRVYHRALNGYDFDAEARASVAKALVELDGCHDAVTRERIIERALFDQEVQENKVTSDAVFAAASAHAVSNFMVLTLVWLGLILT